jgi:ABC-2 type transport system ATP-binding protein
MIEVKNLSKRFGPKTAVDDISFEVKKGEVLGFLGPNGAGKSTTMRMITGYFPPSSGTILIDGIDALEDPIAAKSKIGYLPENAPLYTDMTVTSFLKFCAQMRGLSGAAVSAGVQRAIDLCFLDAVRHQSIDTLSKGYRHRTCFAQAIIHDPDILILDEPTDGLDPNQKHEMRRLIRRMGEDKAIIFSTHILEEVDAACSRAMIIDQGRVKADGTPEELRAKDPDSGTVTVTISGLPGSGIRHELEKLSGAASVAEIKATEVSLVARITPAKAGGGQLGEQVFKLCQERNLSLQELNVDAGRLDNMFHALTMPDTKAPTAKKVEEPASSDAA